MDPRSTSRAPVASIGARLERDRLRRRAHRLERVVDALRQRAHDHEFRGAEVPPPLASSLVDFHRELLAIRRLLHEDDVGAAGG